MGEERRENAEFPPWTLSEVLPVCAVVIVLLTAAIVVLDPSDHSGVLTWVITGGLAFAGYKVASFGVRGAWGEERHGSAFALAAVGIVCLCLAGQAVTLNDVGLSIDPRGTAGDPSYSEPSQVDNVAPGSVQTLDDADGDYVPSGSDANPGDATGQFSEDSN